MSTYNLNDNVEDSFKFQVGGHVYTMRYPLGEEVKKAQEMMDDDKISSNEVNKYFYSFITADDEKAPPIEDNLDGQNIKVIQKFNEMISKEFGA
jgi:hypothetical protein